MSPLLNDALNLEILENICSGTGVEVNINALARILKKHRHTIKEQVRGLFEHEIINRPIYPFMWLYKEYPLLVIARAELPRSQKIDKFLKEDEHIFGAFYVRDEEYNTFLIEFHKDLYSYGEWKKKIVAENKIPPRDIRFPAHSTFFSTSNIIKYQPYSPINMIEDKFKNEQHFEVNGHKLSYLSFQILKKLMLGECIRTNENMLAMKLNVHRKTIEHRISSLIEADIVSNPVCRFPKFFVPPSFILVCCMLEIKNSKDKLMQTMMSDPCIPLAYEANIGRYNMLLFGVFFNVEEHFKWEETYDRTFPDCIGAMKNIYLSPQMTASIDQQKVSLAIIRHKKDVLCGFRLIEALK